MHALALSPLLGKAQAGGVCIALRVVLEAYVSAATPTLAAGWWPDVWSPTSCSRRRNPPAAEALCNATWELPSAARGNGCFRRPAGSTMSTDAKNSQPPTSQWLSKTARTLLPPPSNQSHDHSLMSPPQTAFQPRLLHLDVSVSPFNAPRSQQFDVHASKIGMSISPLAYSFSHRLARSKA